MEGFEEKTCRHVEHGSSKYFKGSIVAYDNSIKENFLDISAKFLIDKGAVSSDTAIKMAENIKNKFDHVIRISKSSHT